MSSHNTNIRKAKINISDDTKFWWDYIEASSPPLLVRTWNGTATMEKGLEIYHKPKDATQQLHSWALNGKQWNFMFAQNLYLHKCSY